MNHHKHIINTILTRGAMLKTLLELEGKKATDKEYDELVKWFEDTYEVNRKEK